MRDYIVCPSPDPGRFSACVLAVGPADPLDEMDFIVSDLQSKGAIGSVVFDVLVANASRVRRYFTAHFDGQRFVPFQFEKIDGDDGMRRHSAELLSQHLPVLDMVMMTPAQRFAVSKGMVI